MSRFKRHLPGGNLSVSRGFRERGDRLADRAFVFDLNSRRQERELQRIVKWGPPRKREYTRSSRTRRYPPTTYPRWRYLRLRLSIHEPHVATGTPVGRDSKNSVQSCFQRVLRIGFPARPA